ncbi:MAG: aminoglycoside phosphotransferase family protein [Armatimonadetes bacterium]|nr:aminoglycoside phosphotransferase family protein [Armatimonadota bacterium]
MNSILDQYLDSRKRQFMLKADICLPDLRLRELRSTVLKSDPAEADARQILTSHFPGGTWSRLREPATGTLCKVFFYGRNNEQLAVRVGRLSADVVHGSLFCDRVVQPKLQNAGLPSPSILVVDCTRSKCPFDFQIATIAAGDIYSRFDDNDELLGPKLDHLARYLARLHNIVCTGYGPLQFEDQTFNDADELRGLHSGWWDYVCLKLEDHISICREASRINEVETERIRSVFDRELLEEPDCTPRLLHGDPGNHNIFFLDPDLVTLIDWEDALAGDPLFDVAMWASFQPERRWKRFFDAYSVKRRSTSNFRFRSDHFWLYYLRIALYKTAHRVRFSVPDRPDRMSPSLRIQRALRALDGVEI